MISDNDFDRLIDLGRRKGSVDLADIKETMPVDSMTTEDLAAIVTLLEEHGIAIELDPELLVPGNWPPPRGGKPLPAASRDEHAPTPPASAMERAGAVPTHAEAHGEAEADGFSIDVVVYAMLAILVLLLAGWVIFR